MEPAQIPPPSSFNPLEDDWERWLQRFERYRVVSGLGRKTQPEQVATLLYTIGNSADDLVTTLRINEGSDNYKQVLKKITDHFAQRTNTIAERARFNKRSQQPSEKIEEFIHALHHLADRCHYGTLRDELIRDRIVVGVRDDKLSEKLQSKSQLKWCFLLPDAYAIRIRSESDKKSRT